MGDIFLADIPGEHQLQENIEAITAGTALELPIARAPFGLKVKEVVVIPQAAWTGNDTNYSTLSIINKTKSGTPTVASLALKAGVNGVAFEAKEITLSTSEADLEVNKDDVLSFSKTVTGTGLATPRLKLAIKFVSR